MCLKKKKLDACMNTFRAASHRDDEAVLFKHAFISTNNDNDTCLFIKVYKGFSLHKGVLTSLTLLGVLQKYLLLDTLLKTTCSRSDSSS